MLGLVGESGSGKTTVGLALLGHTRRGAAIAAGSIRVGDVDILALSSAARRSVRGRVVSYVPQDPAASLNPALRIGTQLRETLEVHGFGSSSDEREARIAEVMREVALPDDKKYLRRYPHQLSGGQQQRVGLAMAFACRPRLIVLDEPTTGLDVTTQAHVLDTVRELAAAHHVAALYVSHDLAVVGTLATRTAVMYAGRIVELGPTAELFANASHPYTRRLVQAIPHLSGRRDLVGIPGRAPSPGSAARAAAPSRPRCTFADRRLPRRGASRCASSRPSLWVKCIRAEEVRATPVSRSGGLERDRAGATSATPCSRSTTCSRATAPATVVHDINLQVAPHECLALVGESGSGKTTLARSIAGLHRDRTGLISLRGAAARRQRARPHARGAAGDPVRLPEPVRLAQPAQDDRPDRAPAAAASSAPATGAAADKRVERDARARLAGHELRRPLPRPALGRRAPARRDRARPGRQPGRPGLRRGHLGARRVRAGGDRRAARPSCSASSGWRCCS